MVFVGFGVKPHVQKVADQMESLFHYPQIFGWPGNGETGDHPKGLALDFMVYRDFAKGQATANYLVQNYDALSITYIIWNRQSYSKPRGTWQRYTRSNPHTDHVHVSFRALPGPYTDPDPDGPPSPDPAPENPLDPFKKGIDFITDPKSWLRMAAFGLGLLLVTAGIIRMRGSF